MRDLASHHAKAWQAVSVSGGILLRTNLTAGLTQSVTQYESKRHTGICKLMNPVNSIEDTGEQIVKPGVFFLFPNKIGSASHSMNLTDTQGSKLIHSRYRSSRVHPVK